MISCDNIADATHDAYKKKRNIIDQKYLKTMTSDLLTYFYKIKNNLLFNKYRVLCVDGTHSPLSKNLNKDGYKLTQNNTYVNSLISGLYDINNNTIIDLSLAKINNERIIYEEQFQHLNKNDIIVQDAGYYSSQMLYELYDRGVYPIFRMKMNDNNVKDLLKRQLNDKVYTVSTRDTLFLSIKLRLVKYTIDDNIYVLGTTLMDSKFTINVLKNLYKKRWDIEEYFKTIKYCLSFKDFHSKKDNLIKQEINTHMAVTILTRIFLQIYELIN